MTLIRIACIAATLAASTTMSLTSAHAAMAMHGRVESVVTSLRNDASFSARNFGFSINHNGSQQMLFRGIAGVRAFNNYGLLNDWAQSSAQAQGVYNGGGYTFTHSVLDSFFSSAPQMNSVTPASTTPASTTPDMFNGGDYKFTHSVLDSYFDLPAEDQIVAQSSLAEPANEARMQPMMQQAGPIPEPATWALMIGGFALAGVALRFRRPAARAA